VAGKDKEETGETSTRTLGEIHAHAKIELVVYTARDQGKLTRM
jgi:phage gp29-like protein